ASITKRKIRMTTSHDNPLITLRQQLEAYLDTQAAQGMMWFNDFGHRYRGDMLTSIIQQVT
ncbi:hypothetical protein PSI23_22670, partial [Xenorhabdus sp. XENO-10]